MCIGIGRQVIKKIICMNKELEGLLSTYLGELLNEKERTFDWVEKNNVNNRINAVYVLLGINCKIESEMQRIIKHIKKII